MINKALRIRIYPNKTQQKKIDITINCCRFVRNHMIERNRKLYERRKEHLNYIAMQNLLPCMKKYLPWLAEADSQALKYACRQVDNAYQRFFRKLGGYPKFSSKRDNVQSYTTTNTKAVHYKIEKIKIPCIGWVSAKDKRELPSDGNICFVTVIRDHGQYYASICYKTEDVATPVQIDDNNVIGLDYKSDGLYTDSNGDCCDMPHYYRVAQKMIVKEQRMLSHKIGNRKGEKCSGNYIRQQKRLFKKTRHVANQRKDFLHKIGTAIAKRYDAVCVEDLNMKALANKGFGNGKATLDNGYGMFLVMLEYKLRDRGKQLICVDKWYPSSQICSCCGYKQKIPLYVRMYDCPQCGNRMDRDYNAAVNIRNEGLRILKEKAA